MAKQGQQSPPLPKHVAPPNEEDPALATTTLFPDISQVSNSTSDTLKKNISRIKSHALKRVDFVIFTMHGHVLPQTLRF